MRPAFFVAISMFEMFCSSHYDVNNLYMIINQYVVNNLYL